MEELEQFIHFLLEAKKNTYAASGALAAPSRPASRDLHYPSGGYQYIDTYLGDVDFIGEEAVWYRGIPVWGMNYYGFMLVDDIPAGFSRCLKGALLRVPEEAPFRGPSTHTDGPFVYTCEWSGNVDRFEGREQIDYNRKAIYRLAFHGGRLRSF